MIQEGFNLFHCVPKSILLPIASMAPCCVRASIILVLVH